MASATGAEAAKSGGRFGRVLSLFGAWALGVACGAGAFVATGAYLVHTESRHYAVGSLPEASPTARQIASKVSPGLQSVARENEDAFVKSSGGLVTRAGVRLIYPVVVNGIPVATEIAVDHVLDKFGAMSVGEIAKDLVEHAASKGQRVDASLLRLGREFGASGAGVGTLPRISVDRPVCRCGEVCPRRRKSDCLCGCLSR